MSKNEKSSKYHFSDFTEKNYSKILQAAKQYYDFELFGTKSLNPHIILRHDCDYSIHKAVKLAQIEHKLGIKSTYFLRLHSEMYNLFEKSIVDRINKIILLGHRIGLHFEYSFYDIISTKELTKKLQLERTIIQDLFNTKIDVFSFHNPETGGAIQINKNLIAGMINTYGKTILSDYHYCSDSNGYWRFERLSDLINEKKYRKLHILIHPEWWQHKAMSPKKRIKRCIDERSKRTFQLYSKITKDSGRKNIG